MAAKRLLVCDLDNTLYDWVGYFVPSFYAMVDAAVEIMRCDRDRLLDDFRRVHQRHHDAEQPFALLETDTVRERYRDLALAQTAEILNPAFHAFNSARKRHLRLYEGVAETLAALADANVLLVAHTESRLYGVMDRLERLDLLRFFRRVYCRERTITAHPDPSARERWSAKLPADKIRELSHHQAKPNPDVLLEICAAEGVGSDQAAYIGDSVARDMLMAKRAGVFAIWAAYGAVHDAGLYEALVRVSHWTPEEVARERRLRAEAETIKPDAVARASFREVAKALHVLD